jgi:uncharacterized membrane protein (UPF0127 family)
VLFINSRSRPLKVAWIDFQGQEHLYRTLQPGESYTQPTYTSQVWVLETAAGGCVKALKVLSDRAIANIKE